MAQLLALSLLSLLPLSSLTFSASESPVLVWARHAGVVGLCFVFFFFFVFYVFFFFFLRAGAL